MAAWLLDGCALNQHHWLLAAATTNVGYSLVVTDTFTGTQKTFANPDLQPAAPIQDAGAFDCADPCGNSALAARITAFTASPGSLATGAPETLSWSLSGAGPFSQSLTGTEVSNVALPAGARSFSFAPQAAGAHTATLTVAGRCGSDSRAASYVVQLACVMPHVDSFASDSSSYCAGQTAVLSWHTSGSGDVSIAPGVGLVPPIGTASVPANATTVYMLSKTAACGSDSAMTTVTVQQPAAIAAFSSDSASVAFGASTTLRFDLTGAVSSWTLSDSLGNIPAFVNRNEEGSLTATYTASDQRGTDTITLTTCGVCNPDCAQSSLTITVN